MKPLIAGQVNKWARKIPVLCNENRDPGNGKREAKKDIKNKQ